MGPRIMKPLADNFDKVYDLFEDPIKPGPEKGFLENANVENLRVLVCGGDGTVQWVLTVIDSMIDDGR